MELTVQFNDSESRIISGMVGIDVHEMLHHARQ